MEGVPTGYVRVPHPSKGTGSGAASKKQRKLKKKKKKGRKTVDVYPETAKELVSFALDVEAPDFRNYIMVSFIDMARAPDLRRLCFNYMTACCAGDINHVELSFPSTGTTISATLERGSYGRENKHFLEYYRHLVIEVSAEDELNARRAIQQEDPLGREYDLCALFDLFTCGCCSFATADRQTCIRVVTDLLLAARILDEDDVAMLTTPQQLFDYINDGELQRTRQLKVRRVEYDEDTQEMEVAVQQDGVYRETFRKRVEVADG